MRTSLRNVSIGRFAATASWTRTLILWLLDLNERRRQRAALMRLDYRLLKDIGLTRTEAEWEYRKPPWR